MRRNPGLSAALAEGPTIVEPEIPELPAGLSQDQAVYLREWATVALRWVRQGLSDQSLGDLIDWWWERDPNGDVCAVVRIALRRPHGAHVIFRSVVLRARGLRWVRLGEPWTRLNEVWLAAAHYEAKLILDLETKLPPDLEPGQTVEL